VAEFTAELVVLIVTNLQYSIFGPKSIAVIVIQFVAGDFDFPALKVLAVEETDPPAIGSLVLLCRTATS